MADSDDLASREQEIIDRALQLQHDLNSLQQAKNDALSRQLRKQLESEAEAKLRTYKSELSAQTEAEIRRIAGEKQDRARLLEDTRGEVLRQITELETRLEGLQRAAEELDMAASAAEEYVRAEASEKLAAMQATLESHVSARVAQFSQYISS